jgi:hypothetical protein
MAYQLLDVDLGGGTGPFKTLETRQWMRDLGVVLSCPHCHGDYLLV